MKKTEIMDDDPFDVRRDLLKGKVLCFAMDNIFINTCMVLIDKVASLKAMFIAPYP